MIRYFNGCIVLNELEKAELKELYNSGGRKIDVTLDVYDDVNVKIYTEKEEGQDYVLAELFGATANILFYLVGGVRTSQDRASLKDIIDEYC